MANIPKILKALYPHIPKIDPSIPYPFIYLQKYPFKCLENIHVSLKTLPVPLFIRFGTKLYRRVVGMPTSTICVPLVANSFLFCYERDFLTSLSDDK